MHLSILKHISWFLREERTLAELPLPSPGRREPRGHKAGRTLCAPTGMKS